MPLNFILARIFSSNHVSKRRRYIYIYCFYIFVGFYIRVCRMIFHLFKSLGIFWMDGWLDGWMDALGDGWTDGRTDGLHDGQMMEIYRKWNTCVRTSGCLSALSDSRTQRLPRNLSRISRRTCIKITCLPFNNLIFGSANALQTAHGLISFKFTFFNSQNTNRLQFILFMLYGSL